MTVLKLHVFLPTDIINVFKSYGKDETFIDKYIINAVLSYIEEKEQELILSLKYNEWVKINIDDAVNKVIDYINKFSIACKGVELEDHVKEKLRRNIVDNMLIHKILCNLYTRGIFNDEISKFIIIKDVPEHECLEAIKNSKELIIRSRFIEIARNLFFVKQRFPDKTVFESTPLVDRVFAYAEPRLLPLGKVKPSELYEEELKDIIASLYKAYNEKVLRTQVSEEEVILLDEILREFFRCTFNFLFYDFQARGLKKILHNLMESIISDKVMFSIIEAPTGAGKTEIFVLALIIMALIRKLSLAYRGINIEQNNTPIGIIVYPRRALASNQVDRLLRYVYELNKIIRRKYFKYKPIVTISMNYTEVRPLKEYNEAVLRGLGLQTLKYGVQVEVIEKNNEKYIELKHFKCPNGYFPRLKVKNGMIDPSKIFCGKDEIDFIRVVKEDVRENPGDIHLTLFETLRNNLLNTKWFKLFGIKGLDGPRIIVLDEIHTYVGIVGARYAYLLRRILSRIKRQMGVDKRGFVIIGVSATIPNPEEFLSDLFFINKEKVGENIIRIKPEETIPLGNEYFYIIVPTLKYKITQLAVTIQNVMTLYYNLPPLTINNKKVKKALVFIDNLDVIERARHDLEDAIKRKADKLQRGLQDLRSPCSELFEQTLRDYNDVKKGGLNLHEVYKFNSWKDGELWWPYFIENIYLGIKENKDIKTIFNRVGLFTSHRKENIDKADIILATSTLEVGIDYSGVILIYQHGMPPNIASLIQRAGRGGRRVIENPLIRTSVAVLLSPEIPSQSHLFEIFTRVRSLREALKYDRLCVSVRNEYVILQTIAELILDDMVLSGKNIYTTPRFECRDYIEHAKTNLNRIISYIKEVIPIINEQEAVTYIRNIISYLERRCASYR